MSALAQSVSHSAAARPVGVVIIDDSSVIRRMVSGWVEAADGLSLLGAAPNGQRGVEIVRELQPDVVILDVEMPVMDGLTALPLIIAARPGVRVVMASALTRRGGEITIKALTAGATDYIAKPESASGGADAYREDLLLKVRALGRISTLQQSLAPSLPRTVTPATTPVTKPDVVLIGASTGGPEALRVVLSELAGKVRQPVFIAQHMPRTFTTILAETFSAFWPGPCGEAVDGAVAQPGGLYVAPGDYHLTFQQSATGAVTMVLNQDPPEHFCRPAVDVMFRSGAAVFGSKALGVVLTGMGADGADGAGDIRRRQGAVLAQDQATSVIWGMPGSVVKAGHANQILPLNDVAAAIAKLCKDPSS